jgi:hypothetical protein
MRHVPSTVACTPAPSQLEWKHQRCVQVVITCPYESETTRGCNRSPVRRPSSLAVLRGRAAWPNPTLLLCSDDSLSGRSSLALHHCTQGMCESIPATHVPRGDLERKRTRFGLGLARAQPYRDSTST